MKEQKKKQNGNKKLSKNNKILFIGIAIVLLAIISFQFIQKQEVPKENPQGDIAAMINDEPITMEELDTAYNALPNQYQIGMSKRAYLDQLIQSKVLYLKAQEQGVDIPDNEVLELFIRERLKAGINDEEYQKQLKQQGITEEELLDQYKKQLILAKYVNQSFLSTLEISDEEIENYYDNNTNLFAIPEQVVVKHILFGNESMSAPEQAALAQNILPKLNEDNFCDYVTNYSTDVASHEHCGEYTFSQNDPLVPEFINLSFSQSPGEMGITDSQFGTHIIWTVQKNPPRTLTLDEVKDQIKSYLLNNKAKSEFNAFYDSIINDVSIEILYSE